MARSSDGAFHDNDRCEMTVYWESISVIAIKVLIHEATRPHEGRASMADHAIDNNEPRRE